MTTSKITVVKLTPSKGKHLKNNLTGEVYKGEIYLAKSLNASNFVEITDEEYAEIKEKESMEYDC